ncbi:histidine kinase [Streptomyces sp. AS58]|uniref:Response regulator n=1 Tax=Streptomyces cadmiisoli TaxID=2184053 RepID=A0A2Z4IZL1_9ACTN|nr:MULTISPECIES: response regulator [Streptomyces]AWW38247.1 response regulator [Streptomyces cadmiisoli]KOV59938.1 histidine kinase [Streptomyces sp. AS58]
MPRTVLIVDDDPGFRAAARALLEADGEFTAAEAGSGAEAVAAVARRRPDAVLLDVGLSPDDGFEDGFAVCRALHALAPATAVVLCSAREAELYGERIARSPARGFLAKERLSSAALALLVARESPGP